MDHPRSQSPLTGVSRTALGVAILRARESAREDRLFEDPYARGFADAAPEAVPEAALPEDGQAERGAPESLGAVFYGQIVLRTRVFDDYLLDAAGSGCAQVVLLAAGLDTRAFRLAWPPGLRLFELDLPELFAFKEEVLRGQGTRPRCERTVVPADLREDWPAALVAAGFRPDAPTAWLAEGLLAYLSAEEAERLLTGVGSLSAPGSRLSFEHIERGREEAVADIRARTGGTAEHVIGLWKGGMGPRTPQWLTEHGWHTEIRPSAELAKSYGRSFAEPPRGGFLTAVRA
ncbi:SAM-dependent methyltransferase [Streptomyces sp. B1866]|uniref:SAM-dependent methyltransferase n=1 Tax=Streptomyces sp. B1866 TaxID=3075431 RepID=UPI00288D51F5|nr:SAM-dependent methyltransferase [Streptomyces sp. B1866]MDT3396291.1 SAM-dependent methyltransferase [Streptomyces sp. B1866]